MRYRQGSRLTPGDSYEITELIKALQNDPATNEAALFSVEWAYLPLLGNDADTRPKLLEAHLATQPDFFCKVIRLIYRSNKEKERE